MYFTPFLKAYHSMGLSAEDINSSDSLQGAFQTGIAEVLGIPVSSMGPVVAVASLSGGSGGSGASGGAVSVSMMVTCSYSATTVQAMVIASLMSGSLTKDVVSAAVAQGYSGDLSTFQVRVKLSGIVFINKTLYIIC